MDSNNFFIVIHQSNYIKCGLTWNKVLTHCKSDWARDGALATLYLENTVKCAYAYERPCRIEAGRLRTKQLHVYTGIYILSL